MKTERKRCAVAFLKAAVAYYASLGITVERVMTDNGSCYRSRRLPQRPAGASASSTSAPSPTPPGPTARPSASSRPPCANGPMPGPTTPHATRRRAALLHAPIQLASSSWQYRRRATHQHTRPDREQPVEAPQLAQPAPYGRRPPGTWARTSAVCSPSSGSR